jgi:outer membrane factor, OMF family
VRKHSRLIFGEIKIEYIFGDRLIIILGLTLGRFLFSAKNIDSVRSQIIDSVVRRKMMTAFRYLVAISAGVTIAFSHTIISSTLAQASSPPSKAPTAQKTKNKETNPLTQARSSVSKPLTLKKNKHKAVSQAPSEQTPAPNAQPTKPGNPDTLNPNANPLIFPTNPNEVKTENDQAVTLQQAVELALRNNKQLQQARLTVESSRKQLQSATASQFPTLDFASGVNNSDSAQGSAGIQTQQRQRNQTFEQQNQAINEALQNPTTTPQQQQELQLQQQSLQQQQQQSGSGGDNNRTSFTTQLQINYDIYSGGETTATIRQAERTVKRDELELERVAEETRFEATRRYYELQNADSQVEIEQGAVRDANQTLRDAQLLEQAGLGTRFDVLRAEVELAQAQQRLTQAEANQANARRQLVATLSLGEQVNLRTADQVQEAGDWTLSLEDSIVSAYKNRAELERFLVEREISDQRREIRLARIRPRLSVGASYELFDQLDESESDLTDGYTLQAQLQWRLFDWGSTRAAADAEEIQKQIAENQFADQRNQIRFAVEQAFNNQVSNKENIVTSKKALDLAIESLRLARLRFQAGVGTQTDVIDAQRQLTEARGSYIQAIINYNQSLNQLVRAVSNYPEGKLFDVQP